MISLMQILVVRINVAQKLKHLMSINVFFNKVDETDLTSFISFLPNLNLNKKNVKTICKQ